jgi:F420-0:gamma-glutamyl ligase
MHAHKRGLDFGNAIPTAITQCVFIISMIIEPVRTALFRERDSLVDFITDHIPTLPEKSILVVTSKIVALAQGRTVPKQTVATKTQLVRTESTYALPTKYAWLTLKDGMLMASAGIDESNADGKLILLPKDSYTTARQIRSALMLHWKVRNLGIIITDSRTLPLRAGVTGVALGYAGFKGVFDYRGKPDLFGRPFVFSRTNVADGLSAAAVVCMGEGNECQPLAVIREAPASFCNRTNRNELVIPITEDMYAPFLTRMMRQAASKKAQGA